MSNKKNNRKRFSGWAYTKKYPHKNHPALFRKKQGDDIEYLTFTHSNPVKFGEESVSTKKLNTNIDYENKGDNRYSHVLPRVYEGERSALGKGTNDFKLDQRDQPIIDDIFKTAKHYPVPRTSNSTKKKSKKKGLLR